MEEKFYNPETDDKMPLNVKIAIVIGIVAIILILI